MRVLMAASGSYGDVFPFIAIGRELKRRGHEVLLFVSPHFSPLVAEAGLTPVDVGPRGLYEKVIRHPDAFHPRKGFRIIARTNLMHLPEAYRRMEERVLQNDTMVVGSTLAFAARLLQEKRGLGTATVHLAPSIFRSAEKPPRFGETGLPAWFPPGANRLLFWAADRLVVDPVFCPDFNRFRAELGLAPIERMFHDWMHAANVVIGLFPEWFAEPQRDWHGNVHLTGFPLYDGDEERGLPEDAARFLDGAAPTAVFTAGTAATSEKRFFLESVGACRLAGIRGVLLTRYPEQIPGELPESVRHFDYLPFSGLLPRVDVLVHHGGIGTSSQALAAGIPQLLRPLAYDQFDNAHRLERLGVASSLPPKRYRACAVAERLGALTSSGPVRQACAAAKKRMEGYDAVSSTCDVLLRELG